MSWFETAPLPLVGVLILAVLLAGTEAGYRGHGWLKRRRGDAVEAPGGPDYLLSAVLGLLALLLGFTFSLALNRYEARRDLVLQEANAIGTTWLRAELLDAPDRSAMLPLLRDYADARRAWSEGDAKAGDMARTTMLQRRLWAATGAALRTDSLPQLSRAVMDSMNQSFDLATARAVARSTHLPDRVFHILLLYALLSAVMLGYMIAAHGKPHRVATGLLLVVLTLALDSSSSALRP